MKTKRYTNMATREPTGERRVDGYKRWLDAWVDLDKGSDVLDAGCGQAIGTMFMQRYHEVNAVGMDPIFGEEDPEEPDIAGRMEALPFQDESFDAIVSSHSLEHVASVVEALNEWRRVLRQDGIAYVVLPYPDIYCGNPLHTAREELGCDILDQGDSVKRIFTENGFTVTASKIDGWREPEIWLKLWKTRRLN